nr:hypothetical protein [Tanacetum cinerariifolium]
MCINCTYGDGKPVTCCKCEGPLRGGFCLFCNLKDSFTNNTSSNFNHLPQPQFENYLCNLCGNNSHDGYDCQQQFSLIYEQEQSYNQSYNDNYYPHDLLSFSCCHNCGGSHETLQSQSMGQNIDFFGSDQIQTPQYPKEYLKSSSNEIVVSNQEKEKPPQDSDIRQFVRKECVINVCEKQKKNMEDTLLELIKVCRQKEFYCMHDNVDDLIKSALNSKLLSINWNLNISPVHAITPVLPIKEPEYSLSMGYEHLSTILETESNEVTKSNAKNLLLILSEYEFTFDDENECDVPDKDESSSVFMTFSNPLFDDNDDFTSSDDESLSNEDVLIKEFKFDYLEEFFGAFMPTSIADEECIRREHAKYISLMERLFTINPCPRPMEISNVIVETLPTSPIPLEDSDSQREEIDIFTGTNDLLPPSIESDDYHSEGEIHVLEELLVDDSISLSENESFYFNHPNDPSFPRPPPEPLDVEFDFEKVISAVVNNIDELNEDECFDPGGDINVSTNLEDDDYFPFMFVIRIFLPYLIYPEVSPLLLFAGSEDTIFDPGISV